MQPEKIKDDKLILHLHDLIEKEFICRNPNYYEPREPLIIYKINPMAVIFEFSNTIEQNTKPNTYQFELDKYEFIDIIKKNLTHRAKLNFSDKVTNRKARIYFTVELL